MGKYRAWGVLGEPGTSRDSSRRRSRPACKAPTRPTSASGSRQSKVTTCLLCHPDSELTQHQPRQETTCRNGSQEEQQTKQMEAHSGIEGLHDQVPDLKN